jgi:hypothetical protein
MRKVSYFFTIILWILATVFLTSLPAYTASWVDEFDGAQLRKDWVTKDRPGNPSKIEQKDGMLRITNPTGNWGHMERDRPLVLRKAPDGDFNAIGLFASEPKLPGDAWHGIFILGDDALDFACLLFGGESNQAQKNLIGSMVVGVWQDKGHFPTGKDVPYYLKLEKVGDQYTGYWSEDPKKAWNKVGNSWPHKLKPKQVGVGFINNWGGKTVTLLVDMFTLEGDKVEPSPVESKDKLAVSWGKMKIKI